MKILIPNSQAEAIFDTPTAPIQTAILFIPGISAGALTDRFLPFANAVTEAGMAILRVEIWKDQADLEAMTIKQIFTEIDAASSYLEGEGYTTIIGVGKSFGGGMLLLRNYPKLKALSLWAPAIGFSETSSFENLKSIQLKEVTKIMDITLDPKMLAAINVPVQFVHGDADTSIPLENSRALAAHISNATIETISGMGHSPKNPEEEQLLISKTVAFLQSNV